VRGNIQTLLRLLLAGSLAGLYSAGAFISPTLINVYRVHRSRSKHIGGGSLRFSAAF